MAKSNEPPPSRFDTFLEQPLPHSDEAERLCLGAILIDSRMAYELFAHVQPKDFYSPTYRRIAEAMKTLINKGLTPDAILIGNEMQKDGEISSIGGVAMIANLAFGLPAYSTIKPHVEIIRKAALSRRMIKFCDTKMREFSSQDKDPAVLANEMSTELLATQYDDPDAGQSLKEVAGLVKTTFQNWAEGRTQGSSLPTGIPELDGRLRLKGLAKGELVLIGARPSMGKTALLIQIAMNVARHNIPVLFISLEMPKEQIVMRMLSPITRLKNQSINPYMLRELPTERLQLYNALDSLDYPIYFDNSFNLPQLQARARHFVETKGVQLIAFDYLTMIKSGTRQEEYSRTNAVGDVVDGMKTLALQTNTALLGAAQFKRGIDKEYRRPRMDEFRDSGVIEQTADVVLFPWDVNAKIHSGNPDLIQDSMWLDLYCEKQRNGSRYWSVPIEFNKDLQLFESPEMSGRMPPAVSAPPKPLTGFERLDAMAYDDFHNRD